MGRTRGNSFSSRSPMLASATSLLSLNLREEYTWSCIVMVALQRLRAFEENGACGSSISVLHHLIMDSIA